MIASRLIAACPCPDSTAGGGSQEHHQLVASSELAEKPVRFPPLA